MNMQDNEGITPLMLAVYYRRQHVRALIEKNARGLLENNVPKGLTNYDGKTLLKSVLGTTPKFSVTEQEVESAKESYLDPGTFLIPQYVVIILSFQMPISSVLFVGKHPNIWISVI